MRTLKNILIILLLLSLQKVFGYGIGYSSYPLLSTKKLVTAEATGILSEGGGAGIQGRFTHKYSRNLMYDAGIGISGGERNARVFAGVDYMIYPDYKRQPRVSVRTSFENAKEFELRRNIVSVAPTFSKGISFWGTPAYPFLAVPLSMGFNSDTKTYQTMANVSFGLTGKLPFKNYKHLTANLEGTVNLKDSFSAVFLGISYTLN